MKPTRTDRFVAANLARQVYGNRIANDILDGTIERHHFIDALAAHRIAALEEAAGLLDRYSTPFGRAGSAPDAIEGQMRKMAEAIRSLIPGDTTKD